ncbi:Hypothetical predicted protein [Mytilus galloprovincialis]|uniref:Uncharacterized protein n=1 Tax=Mytilus galloprovincialis TaxID=29158 RepID=A0A8B6HLJ3_MYTGA|nr:Hypothetical predicted protein [Mytilus galloprovincialis]
MIWGCICWNAVGTLTPVEGNINAVKYQEIVDEHLWPVIARHFPGGNYFFPGCQRPCPSCKFQPRVCRSGRKQRYEMACTVPRLEYNRTNFKLSSSEWNHFMCRSEDGDEASIDPVSSNMRCGSRIKPFKYQGVFLNKSLNHSTRFLNFNLTIQMNRRKKQYIYNKEVFFEIGFAYATIHTNFLRDAGTGMWEIRASACENKYGICCDEMNGIFPNIDHDIMIRGNFRNINIDLTVYSVYRNSASDGYDNDILTPVVALHQPDLMNIAITVNSSFHSIGFDRSTLHRHLFISGDKRTVSNHDIDTKSICLLNLKKPFIYSYMSYQQEIKEFKQAIDIKIFHPLDVKSGDQFLEMRFGVISNKKKSVAKLYGQICPMDKQLIKKTSYTLLRYERY